MATKNSNNNSNDNNNNTISSSKNDHNNNSTSGGDGTTTEMKQCRCVLCGQMIIASCEDDCIKHMETCSAFDRVHPINSTGTGVDTNPNGVYPPSSSTSDSGGDNNPRIEILDDNDEETDTTTPTNTIITIDDIENNKLSIKELRQLIIKSGLSYKDCIEKNDLKIRAKEALQKQ